jgi:hypothetical protein
LNKEVIANPKQARKLLKMLSVLHTMLLLPLVTSGTAMAAPANPVPQELTDSLMVLVAVIAALGVVTAMITLMTSGIWKMFFGRNKATEWGTEILKGLSVVLGAPILVALIVGVFTLLFSNVPVFQPLISPITVFFHR